jgi:hypothetical protein
MRHLRSIFYALVLAPCIWVLLAVGFTDDLSSRGREFFTAESVSGLLLLIFSGILFSILAAGPVSPAGPVLAGAVYLGVTVWAFNAPEAYAALWSPDISKEGFDLSRPGYGLAAVLAVPLLGTALSARRWARYEPPVLPIIGEIGRFRGAAKVIGTPVAAEQTTVIRTGVPADPTVALNRPADSADRTVAFNSVPANRAPADRTEVVANNDRTVFVTQPQSPAAPKPAAPKPAAPAPRAAEPEPTTVLPIGSHQPAAVRGAGFAPGDEPTVVSGMALAQPKPAATPAASLAAAKPATASASVTTTPAKPATVSAAAPAKPATASAPVAPASGSASVTAAPASGSASVTAAPASGSASVATPAKPATASAAVAAKPANGSAPVAATPAKPATEPVTATAAPAEASAEKTVTLDDQDKTTPLSIPAKATKPAEEPTALVTPPSDETEPLKLPAEPTAVIPAQRRPPTVES